MSASDFPEPTVTAVKTNVRIDQDEARRILGRLEGMTAEEAHHALKFRPGLVSAPLAGVLEQGLAEAGRFGIESHELEVGQWSVTDGDVITRLRRMAHGIADWITTRTARVEIRLRAVTWQTPDDEPSTDARKVG